MGMSDYYTGKSKMTTGMSDNYTGKGKVIGAMSDYYTGKGMPTMGMSDINTGKSIAMQSLAIQGMKGGYMGKGTTPHTFWSYKGMGLQTASASSRDASDAMVRTAMRMGDDIERVATSSHATQPKASSSSSPSSSTSSSSSSSTTMVDRVEHAANARQQKLLRPPDTRQKRGESKNLMTKANLN